MENYLTSKIKEITKNPKTPLSENQQQEFKNKTQLQIDLLSESDIGKTLKYVPIYTSPH